MMKEKNQPIKTYPDVRITSKKEIKLVIVTLFHMFQRLDTWEIFFYPNQASRDEKNNI